MSRPASAFDALAHDLRQAVRTLRRAPGLTAAALLILALGIGANTALFSVVNALLLRTLPVADPDRLGVLSARSFANGGWTPGWDLGVWKTVEQHSPSVFDGAAAASAFLQPFNLAARGEMDVANGLFVSGNYFTVLGIAAALGRPLTPADDVRGGGAAGPVAVISHAFWQRRFGGDPAILDAPLAIEGTPFTIVGITPPGFRGTEVGRRFDIAVPIGTAPLLRGDDSDTESGGAGMYLSILFRVRRDLSFEEAGAALRRLQPALLQAAYGATLPAQELEEQQSDPWLLVRAATGTSELRQEYERALVALLLVVGAVLLIACVNVAQLLLVRAGARERELAVRSALGAPAWRLARVALMESAVVAAAGAAVATLVGSWMGPVLASQLITGRSDAALDASIDLRVLAFTAGVALLAILVSGTAPALRTARTTPNEALRRRSSAGSAAAGTAASTFLIVQVALSVVLLVAAGLLVQTFARLQRQPLGFDADRVLVATLDARRARVQPDGRLRLYQRVAEAAARLPNVEAVGISPGTPFDTGPTLVTRVAADGGSGAAPGMLAAVQIVSPRWFETYGTIVRTGRPFTEHDRTGSAPVAIVNEALARQLFADGNAAGRTVRLADEGPSDRDRPRTIVGVAEDASHHGPRSGVEPTIYYPLAQWEWGQVPFEMRVSLRFAGAFATTELRERLAAVIADVDPDLTFSVREIGERVRASVARERLAALVSVAFGLIALLLAATGLYGVTAYAAARRRQEIGVRRALGAPASSVMLLVAGPVLVRTAAGLLAGVAAAAAVTEYLEALLFGLTPLDPLTYAGVAIVLVLTAAVAAVVPARRAALADPVSALQCE